MARLGVTPDEVWMVGDRCFDIDGAHEHGMRAVGVRYGYAEGDELNAAEKVVDTVAELQAFLEEQVK